MISLIYFTASRRLAQLDNTNAATSECVNHPAVLLTNKQPLQVRTLLYSFLIMLDPVLAIQAVKCCLLHTCKFCFYFV